MKSLLVNEWMRTEVITVNPELRVERAWELMERRHIRHLPVVQQGQLVGMVTERDLKRAVFAATPLVTVWTAGKPQPTGTPGDLAVQAIMTQAVRTAKPTDTLLNAAVLMQNEKVGALPVVDDAGQLVGLLSQSDLLKALVFLLERNQLAPPAREDS
ncbi:MAG: CBS domain-containing protein [Deltaproteobacteria bacterium]|nr:CBS domain-containing protein [Deltaproteobacteria bacterium]